MESLTDLIKKHSPSQSVSELSEAIEFIHAHKANVENILEIGVHRGGSFKVWRDAFNPDKLLGIDIHMSGIQEIVDEIKDSSKYKILVPEDSHSPVVMQKVKDFFGDSKLDLLFIDGDHTLEGAKQDFMNYKSMVNYAGFIIFHDIKIKDREDMGVHTLWNQIKNQYTYREFYHPEESGTGTGLLHV